MIVLWLLYFLLRKTDYLRNLPWCFCYDHDGRPIALIFSFIIATLDRFKAFLPILSSYLSGLQSARQPVGGRPRIRQSAFGSDSSYLFPAIYLMSYQSFVLGDF
jgi:hypothetical protein